MRNLTTSLELSQELKKENVPQESMFYWIYIAKGTITNGGGFEWQLSYNAKEYHTKETIKKGFSAFLAEEIGRWLPIKVVTQKSIDEQSKWMGFYKDFDEIWYADTVADLWGKMLLYLLRQGQLSVKDLK